MFSGFDFFYYGNIIICQKNRLHCAVFRFKSIAAMWPPMSRMSFDRPLSRGPPHEPRQRSSHASPAYHQGRHTLIFLFYFSTFRTILFAPQLRFDSLIRRRKTFENYRIVCSEFYEQCFRCWHNLWWSLEKINYIDFPKKLKEYGALTYHTQ